jgi:uncharacterized membrane protein YoaK (UPF0700 family)
MKVSRGIGGSVLLSFFCTLDLAVCFPGTHIQRLAVMEEANNDGKQQNEGPSKERNDDVQLILIPETTLFFPQPPSHKIVMPQSSSSSSSNSKRPAPLISRAAASSKQRVVSNNKTIFTISLLILTGITEGIFFHRYKCFPNMMTGNTIRCLDALADWELSTARMHGSLILAYVTGGALFKFLDVFYKRRQEKEEERRRKDFPSTITNAGSSSSSSTTSLVWVARLAFLLFGISDLMGLQRDIWRLPPLALGFGMINAATVDAVGMVTNAVTGHWTKIGVGMAECCLLKASSKGYRTSLQAVGTFVSTMLVTNIVYRWLETTQAAPMLLSRLPPLGMSLGVLYTSLLTWYSHSCGGGPP